MWALEVGAAGLLRGASVSRLIEAGCEVVGPRRAVDTLDIAAARSPEVWFSDLTGIDAVVRSAGVLRGSSTPMAWAICTINNQLAFGRLFHQQIHCGSL